MRRLLLITSLLASLLVPVLAAPATAAPGWAVALGASRAPRSVSLERVAFRGFRLGGGGFGRRRGGFGGFGRRSSRGLLHSIARALAFAYLFHLLFSHGGLSILLWVIVIAVLVHLVRRRRRRPRDRYSY